MYITAYVKTVELDIVSVVALSPTVRIKADSYRDPFFNSLKFGNFDCVRVVFQRNTKFKGVEYHCVDFTGRSFIAVDPTGSDKTPQQAIDWVNEQDIKHSLCSKNKNVVYVVGPEKLITRPPRNSEEYFHKFVIAESSNFFFSRNNK